MDIIIKRRVVSFAVLPVIAGVLLLFLVFATARVARIQADEIGVFVNNVSGAITVRTLPGATVYNGWLTDFYSLDNTEQSYRMGSSDRNDAVKIKTSNGADVTLDVAVNYRLIDDPNVIRTAVVPECGLSETRVGTADSGLSSRGDTKVDAYKLKWIRDYSRSVIRYKFGELTPKEFYVASKRNEKARECVAELNLQLQPHGIDVRLVVPEKFSFYEELETIINDKKAAEQEVEKQKSLAKAALEEQKRDMTTATAAKNVAIAQIKGQLEKELLVVEAESETALKAAEAYAYKTRTLADATFYEARNESQSILARAEAEAAGLAQLAASLSGDGAMNIVKMRYADALRNAVIRGVPYATDPRIQKVELDTRGGTPR